LFMDKNNRFYLRPEGLNDLIYRPSEESDGAVPASGSYMIRNLIKINRLTENKNYLSLAESCLKSLSGYIAKSPNRMTSALKAFDYFMNDKIEIVIVGEGQLKTDMLKIVYNKYLPNSIIAISTPDENNLPLFEGRVENLNEVKAYVCKNSVCNLPALSVEQLKNQLGKL
ncbi:MAG: hypothetical protein U9N54_11270, partial [candidate division Zixibacteria bacterium]|nr:hypothetical protein [candidate division Zixibacteria bacterium]